ncbi:transcriptional repressor AgaR [Colwellia sp. Bg11-28]|uniref:transcriptional repressor AgaR n=1 Tax=Colwellia sp. Bg11-28 TaxID=2058305 RepID=UPI000C337E40|nr:transcriptional repressor AgaR [Colwellia sp. Bg11-28]PKH88530.1 DeoR family transcriptional regulator [Colwellia sp. Bg11-28]
MISTIERHSQIVQQVEEMGKVSVDALSHQYDVSTVTIRNDLNNLDKRGLIVRFHGGATVSNGLTKELSISQKHHQHNHIKQLLAQATAKLVNDRESIILDSGSTTEEVALSLYSHKQLKVMTNGLNVAAKLAENNNIEVMVTGGTLRQKSLSFFDAKAEESLTNLHFDKVILGVDGFDLEAGITTHFSQEASLNRLMCNISSEIIAVTDSSKFGKRGCHIISAYNKITTLVTDSGIPDDYAEKLTKAGVQLCIVNEA